MNDITALMNAESATPPASGVDLERVLRDGRRRRRRRVVVASGGASLTAVAVAGGLLLVTNLLAPAASPPGSSGGGTGPGPTLAVADPVGLLGVWAVSGTDEKGDVRLGLTTRELRVDLECGALGGAWAANKAGQFVAHISGSIGDCAPHQILEPPTWLKNAVGFRIDGDAAELIDARGEVTARLSPRPASEVPDMFSEGPGDLDAFRAAIDPVPLPAGLRPATAEALVGRWVTTKSVTSPTVPFVLLNADGSWEGSDGCNGQRGRWLSGPDGLLLATANIASTLVYCDGDQVPLQFAGARRAGFDGDLLVLLDPGGDVLGRVQLAR